MTIWRFRSDWPPRFLRWSVAVSLILYLSLLFMRYNWSVRLKSNDVDGVLVVTVEQKQQEEEDRERRRVIESLLYEMQEERAASSTVRRTLPRKDEALFKPPAAEHLVLRDNRQDPRTLLEDVFRKADANGNGLLDIQELAKWIHAKITEHIARALRENVGLFTIIDNNPRNGEITWEEYHAYFLRSHGFSERYISSHDRKHKEMSRTLKESIMRDRARWAEAARNDPDALTLDEFLAFTHPESSHRALLQMVDDLFEKFDRDGDELLTEDEFSEPPSDGIGLELKEDSRNDEHEEEGERDEEALAGSDERRKEFRHLIDKNRDGKADRAELLMYIDPRNPRHAIQEAQHLISLSDSNQDGKLDLSEIFSKMDLFLESKMIDTEKSFHDEFR
ncbi:45 kDa calcium-binding protein isoform X2 [Prorops nasuta]